MSVLNRMALPAVTLPGIKNRLRSLPLMPAAIRLRDQLALKRQFKREFASFQQMAAQSATRHDLRWEDRYPRLNDRTANTGFDRHYMYHTAWAARIVAQQQPEYHSDFSSLLYFSALVSAFVPVRQYEFRPASLRLDGLSTHQADLLNLPFADGSLPSVSCMHVVEHLGLGRYGDPLDPDADLKAMLQLQRVVAPGGMLLFVVPIGQARICFNAHRIYPAQQIIDQFSELKLRQLTLIPDDRRDGELVDNPSAELLARQRYGCGCFWFERTAS